MIQYKLIKEYPGSPKLGTIDWYKNDDGFNKSSSNWQGTNFYDAHTEFWQKVEELDYLITEVKYSGQIRKLKQGEYRILDFGIGFKLDYVLKYGGTIFSVKRLSDGEVFTIGDVIANMCDSEQKISELYINKDGKMCVYTSTTCRFTIQNIKKVKTPLFTTEYDFISNKINGEIFTYNILKSRKHNKENPLFTTEDGVVIFEGDKYYFINNGFNAVISFGEDLGVFMSAKTFSTKEKAEEYILLNKPCLSLNDLLSVWGSSLGFPNTPEHYKTAPLFKSFESLAKSKL